jgi:hypothetical protein
MSTPRMHSCIVEAFQGEPPPPRAGFYRRFFAPPGRVPYWHYIPQSQEDLNIEEERTLGILGGILGLPWDDPVTVEASEGELYWDPLYEVHFNTNDYFEQVSLLYRQRYPATFINELRKRDRLYASYLNMIVRRSQIPYI